MSYYVYIVECSDETFYTGIARDVKRRVEEHNSSDVLGAKYTRNRRPVKLKYKKEYPSRSLACKEESRIKRMQRNQKINLIQKNSSS